MSVSRSGRSGLGGHSRHIFLESVGGGPSLSCVINHTVVVGGGQLSATASRRRARDSGPAGAPRCPTRVNCVLSDPVAPLGGDEEPAWRARAAAGPAWGAG